MKAISNKQFDNAVAKVLNGEVSKMITTQEEKPFYWSRSGGYNNLKGSIPANSKFLRNDARGGKKNDVYLVCYLASGYEIKATKAEISKIAKIEANKKASVAARRQNKSDDMKILASKLGFSSVAKLKEAQKEIDIFNNARFDRAVKLRYSEFIELYGAFDDIKVVDRVRLQNIQLIFDCERKEDLF